MDNQLIGETTATPVPMPITSHMVTSAVVSACPEHSDLADVMSSMRVV